MTESLNATCPTTDAYAIGSVFNATQAYLNNYNVTEQPPTDCTPFTGSDYKSIVATTITQMNGTTQ